MASSMPSLSRSSDTTPRSSTRITTLSPKSVGRTDTRRSTGWPPTFSSMRPSCGIRRSAMSRFAITLMRVVIAKARCLGGGTISWSTPSALSRIRNSCSKGSKWMSLAPSRIARRSTMFKSLRTGALSARASMLVRSVGPSRPALAAAAARSPSCSRSSTSDSTLSVSDEKSFSIVFWISGSVATTTWMS